MNCVLSYIESGYSESEKPAIVFYKGIKSLDNSVSFKELTDKAIKAQIYLKNQGFVKNDIILLFEQPSADLYAFILASLGLGIKLMIIEPWMKSQAINDVMRKTPPKAVMTGILGKMVLLKSSEFNKIKNKFNSSIIEKITRGTQKFEVLDVESDHHAILTFTTGTSGTPKGVHRKHQYLLDQNSVLRKYLPYDEFNKLDLTVFTNIVLLNLTLGKGSLVLNTKWKSKMLKSLDQLPPKFQVDTTACGPYFLELLMRNTKKVDLKVFLIGGALGDNDLYKDAIKKWPSADMNIVYGSTEAEPVSTMKLNRAVELSEKSSYFQTLYLGLPIEEIDTKFKEDVLWVSGIHVSPMYENDPKANAKNKETDSRGITWHNMGDKIKQSSESLIYQGRDFQTDEEFQIEQKIYNITQSSKSFVQTINNQLTLVGEDLKDYKEKIREVFPQIQNIIDRKIVRDPRHRARIDRVATLAKGVIMKNMFIFFLERVPVLVNILLAIGILYSAEIILGISASFSQSFFIVFAFQVFTMELRFMDEYKDFEKDKIAHPTRPLPRGLISTNSVMWLIKSFFIILILTCISTFTFFTQAAGVMFTITTIWLYLMYKEFFISKQINKSPIIYAISHQVIIVPATLFIVGLIAPESLFSSNSIHFALFILSAFFSFEIGRKMNPDSDPILGTYLIHYKKIKTHLLITILLLLGVYTSYHFGKGIWALVPFIIISFAQALHLKNENKYKLLEILITLNLIYSLWMLPLAEYFK